MEFGEVALDQALGAIMAHSVPLPGGRMRKGRVLDVADLACLRAAGVAQVTVARLDPGDVPEDDAALALAQALVPDAAQDGLELRAVGTGRVNIFARGPGLARVQAVAVHALNAVDPSMTVATVPEWQRMAAGGMVATVKIIAYAVPGRALQRACEAAKGATGQGALGLCPATRQSVALIETLVPGTQATAKGESVMRQRVTRLGARLDAYDRVPHDATALAAALCAQPQAQVLMILTGSATSDIRDTAPQAVRLAEGEVHHFGMPVDPGNLLFIGSLGGRPVIGLPGCARSPALNGADWVLERLICGIAVSGQDIASMGVGGLLTEIPTRPRPREG